MDTPIKREKLYNMILSVLSNNSYTAHEIAQVLYWENKIVTSHRQEVAPRLTELVKMDRVEIIGTHFDEGTKKTVSVYKIKVN